MSLIFLLGLCPMVNANVAQASWPVAMHLPCVNSIADAWGGKSSLIFLVMQLHSLVVAGLLNLAA